jgi:hypothetical protein
MPCSFDPEHTHTPFDPDDNLAGVAAGDFPPPRICGIALACDGLLRSLFENQTLNFRMIVPFILEIGGTGSYSLADARLNCCTSEFKYAQSRYTT